MRAEALRPLHLALRPTLRPAPRVAPRVAPRLSLRQAVRLALLLPLLLAQLLAQPALADSPAIPRFAPVPVPAHSYTGGWEHFVGGGVATLDCNHDLLPDLYVAGGSSPAELLRNTTATRGGPIRFAAATPPALALTGHRRLPRGYRQRRLA